MKVFVFAGLILLGSTATAVFQAANLYTFSGDVEITEAPPNDGTVSGFISSGQHFVAARGDTVYVVWQESRLFTPPVGTHIFLAKSTDGGHAFGPNIPLAAGYNPSMKVDTGGVIYIAYEGFSYIYFTKSTDGGNTFLPPVLVIDSAGLSSYQETPSIAVNNKGQIFIAWLDRRNAPQPYQRTVFAAASYDRGKTFTPNVHVNDSTAVGSPDIAADDSGRVYVVYDGSLAGIIMGRSIDSGQSFSYHTLASDLPADSGSTFALDPSIAVSQNGIVGVVWEEGRQGERTLRFSKSQDFGQTFSPSVIVDSSGAPQTPSLVWKNGIFYVAWRGNHPRPPDSTVLNLIYFSYSPNGGQTFAPYVEVVTERTNLSPFDFHFMGSLTVNEKRRAYVVWFDDRYDPIFEEIFHIFGAWGTPAGMKGDLNLDGMLTAMDVVLELDAAFLGQPFPAPFESADVNCDFRLTAPDVVLLIYAVFLGNPFPCNSSFTQ